MSVKTAIRQTPIEITLPERMITGEELFAMGDIGPAELVRGEVVRQMPTGHSHGIIESLITFFLTHFVRQHRSGHVMNGEVGIYIQRNPDTVRAADVAFISNERYQQVQSPSYLDVAPELVVEIMSPSDSWSDVHEKLADYFVAGVTTIWVVDPQLEQIHIYRALDEVTLLTKADELTGGEILPGFQVPLTDVFP
jgi:Uma2 family endonuclease